MYLHYWEEKIFKYYVDTYVHLAICTISLAYFDSIIFDAQYHTYNIFIIFISVIWTYNCLLPKDTPAEHNIILPLDWRFLLSGVVCIVFAIAFLGYEVTILYGIALLITLIYFGYGISPLLTLRTHTWGKAGAIAMVFTIVTSIIPMYNSAFVDWSTLPYLIGRFVWIYTLCILFDIGDSAEDIHTETPTLATVYSVNKAKQISTFLIVVAAVCIILSVWSFIIDIHMGIIWAVVFFATWVAQLLTNEDRSKRFFLLYIDGLIALPWLLYNINTIWGYVSKDV